jgi:hypothetical protein
MSGGTKAVTEAFVGAAKAEFEAERAAADGEQLPMFPAPLRKANAFGVPLDQAAIDLELREHHGPGRPAGSPNKSTEDWRQFLLGRGVSPLVQMMRWSLMTPTLLAQELGCSRLEAFDRLKSLWVELAPYTNQQLPRAVEIAGASAGMLVLGVITAEQKADIEQNFGPEALRLVENKGEQNQVVTIDATPQSHEDKSHEK